MKLSEQHQDRINAIDGCVATLSHVISIDSSEKLVAKAQEMARFIVETAPDDADPGRISYAIDSLRAALDALNNSIDIGNAKRKRTAEPPKPTN